MIDDSLIYKIYILKFIVLLNSVFLNCNLHLTEKKIFFKKKSVIYVYCCTQTVKLNTKTQLETIEYKNTTLKFEFNERVG